MRSLISSKRWLVFEACITNLGKGKVQWNTKEKQQMSFWKDTRAVIINGNTMVCGNVINDLSSKGDEAQLQKGDLTT